MFRCGYTVYKQVTQEELDKKGLCKHPFGRPYPRVIIESIVFYNTLQQHAIQIQIIGDI